MRRFHAVSVAVLLALVGCAGDPPSSVLGEPLVSDGPRVVFDLVAKPLPEIPLPNNVATRMDPTSPTGRYLNVSKLAPTFLERDMRTKANTLDGFASFAPITVSFDAPLDLKNLVERHATDDDFSNDAVYLVDIDPNSPQQGKAWPIDIGSGNFPVALEKRANYFANDVRATSSNILFEVIDEDINGNGELDPGEDSDWDGHLDRPNFIDPKATPESFLPEGYALDEILCEEEGLTTNDFHTYENLASFWEAETNTLIMRPVLPLRQGTTYAVVLTSRLVGQNGQSVTSPWIGRNHASQDEALAVLPSLLPELGLNADDVAFAWTYTTGYSTRELEWIRAGLYGHGKMAYLKDQFPDTGVKLDQLTTNLDTPFFATGEAFEQFMTLILTEITDNPLEQEALMADYESTGGVIMGRVTSPNFLVDRDGIATDDYPADDDEIIEIDPVTGEAVVDAADVTWWCMLPKRTEAHGDKPFKTVIYGHGYTSARVELLGFAARVNRFGMALCGLDAFGHGFVIPDEVDIGDIKMSFEELINTFLDGVGLTPTVGALKNARHRDLNNDGEPDSGGDFWTADTFHTRDVVRQTIVDHMQFIRIFRTFDGKRTWNYDMDGDGFGDLAGDFDGDGKVDLGGGGDNFYMMGGSLGGIISAIMGGIEPALSAVAPVAGGAGLIDIAIRSRQGGVPQAVFLPIMGPFILGNPSDEGGIELSFLLNDVNRERVVQFGHLPNANIGDRIELINHHNGESVYAYVPSNQKFRFSVEGDALTATERRPLLGFDEPGAKMPIEWDGTTPIGDHIELRVYDGSTDELKFTMDAFDRDVVFQNTLYPEGAPLVMLQKGLGMRRNSPDLRRMMSIAQMILEGGDPVRYAPHYDNPLNFDYDPDVVPGSNALVIPTAGDMNVPVNTGIQIARAAGLIELHKPNPDYQGSKLEGMSENRAIIATYTNEAVECLPRWRTSDGKPVLFDIDDLDFGVEPFDEPTLQNTYGVPPLRVTLPSKHDPKGVSGMRMPLVAREGTHGFNFPEPYKTYDINNFMNNLTGYYFYTDGQVLADDICMEKSNCTVEANGFALPFPQADWEKVDHSSKDK